MKIKEVISATGLTDRAIRLYIDEGLLSPGISENYNGRKSIEFSTSDVEKLKNISLLRRADFSISQIKCLDIGGKEAENSLREFIQEKEAKHNLDGRIIAALNSLTFDGTHVNLQYVASSLTDEVLSGTSNKDLKPDASEIFNSLFNIASSLAATLVLGYVLYFNIDFYLNAFKYPKYNGNFISLIAALLLFLAFTASVIILVKKITTLYRKDNFTKYERIQKLFGFLVGLQLILIIPTFAIIGWMPFVESKTDYYVDYLKVDSYVTSIMADEIYELFPSHIPSTVFKKELHEDAVTYYYRYSDVIDSECDIFAEWNLTDAEFEKEIARITNAFPDAEIVKKGRFTCLYIKKHKRMFAYCPETNTVRYGISFRLDSNVNPTPYYESIEWE